MLIKLHVLFAFLSLGLLFIRGIMLCLGKNWRNIKILKILPHLSDTLLLVSGLYLLYLWDFDVPLWLVEKFILLVLYVFFSTKFFSRKQAQNRPHFLILALLSFIGAMLLAYFR
ncbi:SirB2 family protein [Rodentibacter myodis]|uniref:Invasion protein expression up-regulator SirB n=1 Tax=Rodentibacter myodis TaxID=1907939 RepID=A0A1V3JQP2_9PAST|nr:SirB2 family protein [Rodentibacter myodis]OOF58994.1 hypothetical protein BKL49_05500 [Rodentibacter myodis]